MTRTVDAPQPPPADDGLAPARRRRPVLVGATAVAVVFLVLVGLVAIGGDDESGSRSSLIGAPAPDVELVTLDGTTVRLSDHQGRRVIVNFFNDWCVPCRNELPYILEFMDRHEGDESVEWVWIARDYTPGAIAAWARTTDPPGHVLLDPRGVAADAFRTTGQPETYALDADGVIREYDIGEALSADQFEVLLDAASGSTTG